MTTTYLQSTLPPPMSVSLGPPRDAALQSMELDANLLNQLGKVGGKKKGDKKKKGKIYGGANELVVVPTITPIYKDNAAGGQDAVSTTIKIAANANQSVANGVYDKYASYVIPVPPSQFQKGGTHIVGEAQPWPSCYSGGKKTYKKKKGGKKGNTKKSKKSKKSRKNKNRKRKTIRRN